MKYNNIYIQKPLLDLRKFFEKRGYKVNMIEKYNFLSNTNYIKLELDKTGKEIDIIFDNKKDNEIEKYEIFSKDDLKYIADCLFCLDFNTFNNVKKNGIFSVEDLEIIILELIKIKKTFRGILNENKYKNNVS